MIDHYKFINRLRLFLGLKPLDISEYTKPVKKVKKKNLH